ncbi:bactofilin family protein [Cellvibrio japonicus]|uniref:Putative cell morphology protein n=1 Tax=Cellvibrio japonicus (strain Ueda107) TaxID=498211 RepID=B3PL75_CELJU|nr:polymer-forming cytoskeletal protein [Cellvibrio japonicus]ACE86050.1 putative cell morphology protein [Cellvibrio japonicus Ueda107]QEI11536.1 polymer-forming cytoskeletal protein [Cellvibrio japonicus]QEI15110.1 polymer-forming cytoskeletal protein [Cellvibrio japonicus]QEI18690.1 polymer-forming cytoskeletal protein [Cellvibrio japonicus]
MAFSNNHTLISRGTRLVGDLHFSGDLQLEGQIEGNIFAEASKDAKLVIADTGLIKGEIHVPVVVVNGRVEGNIHAAKHLELAKKAWVTGTVHYNVIEIVNGAKINGSLVNTNAADKSTTQDPVKSPEPTKLQGLSNS